METVTRRRWIARRRWAIALILLPLLVSPACGSRRRDARNANENEPARLASAADRSSDFDPSTVPGRVHQVQPNETLWSLSEMYYGNSRHWRKILVANRRRVTDPTSLTVGMKLIIP
ncbi:MAG TPA: LysM peptidoglycan-binding domain-containing protein [Phycisphaerae bacterium]|nr:LysM peptidoglycan-binding domain-containing protein [Phycisphaerae bacterium]